MTQSRVSTLKVIDSGASASLTEDALLQRITSFIGENLLDLEGDFESDVLLEAARSDERRLGVLSPFEKRAFVLAALLEQRINDMLIEFEATSTEQVTRIMRERHMNFMQAASTYLQEARASEDNREELNMCAMTHTNLVTLYDWSVRQRFNEWKSFLIVRTGFVLYAHG